jgi:uncharacterized membrane protein YwzB
MCMPSSLVPIRFFLGSLRCSQARRTLQQFVHCSSSFLEVNSLQGKSRYFQYNACMCRACIDRWFWELFVLSIDRWIITDHSTHSRLLYPTSRARRLIAPCVGMREGMSDATHRRSIFVKMISRVCVLAGKWWAVCSVQRESSPTGTERQREVGFFGGGGVGASTWEKKKKKRGGRWTITIEGTVS